MRRVDPDPRMFRGPIEFEGVGLCFYRRGAFRVPEAGEFYLSGAVPMAYRAPNRLGNPYRVVRPIAKARPVTRYEIGETIEIPDNRPLRLAVLDKAQGD